MAGNLKIEIDDKDFLDKVGEFTRQSMQKSVEGIRAVAYELLRLSQREVPHDTGWLQNTGHVEEHKDEMLVGYNTVYAARLHEHPEFNFQKGRKGKYVEDPIKQNLRLFVSIIQGKMAVWT